SCPAFKGFGEELDSLFFGAAPQILKHCLLGYLIEAKPANACQPINAPPLTNSTSVTYVALIQRNDCSFTTKVLHAQQAGYQAAVIHNVNSQALVTMLGKEDLKHQVNIPSLFIGESPIRCSGEGAGLGWGRPGFWSATEAHWLTLNQYFPCSTSLSGQEPIRPSGEWRSVCSSPAQSCKLIG
uniref:PA domain-containing protein n=1 Tax=Pseudonaja textilis TaxID=8673 RepID=A0A670XNY2_PSETE